MFERIGRLAEAAATNVSLSRRGFFGQLGRVALGTAGVVGSLLALPGAAHAGGSVVCCKYYCAGPFAGGYQCRCRPAPYKCPKSGGGCLDGGLILVAHSRKSNCTLCYGSYCS